MTAGAVVSLRAHDRRQRHHVAVRRARVVLAQVGRLRAELLIALHVHAIGAVVEVEVVHILRPEQHRQRVGHLADRQAERPRLVAIDRDDELRIVGRKGREQSGHASRLIAGGRHLLRHVAQAR